MKTVTAKEFQLNQSQMMNDVASGTVYQVTFHGKPWVELHPGVKTTVGSRPGSPQAFRQSLQYTLPNTTLPEAPDYKAIRRQHLSDKFGV